MRYSKARREENAVMLSNTQIEEALDQAATTFPHFSNWQTGNEDDDLHFGFCLWGRCSFDENKFHPRHFFITLEHGEDGWRGHWTIGQHAYLWTSADFGDAYLVSTEALPTVDETLQSLREKLSTLFQSVLTS